MSVGRISKYDAKQATGQQQWQCGLYLRLSREDGDKLESDSISNQRKIIDRFLEKHPDLQIFDVYIDDGYTGTNFNRPSMNQLMEDIKKRKVNCLIVKDLSRFGRNYYETGRYLEVVFPLLQLRFISINDNIDSFQNPQSVQNASVSFKNVMNDEYARDISNKIRSSLIAKRKKGDYIATTALYGYKKDPNDHHRLIVDEEAAEIVRLIYRLFIEGISIYNISVKLKELGIPNPTDYKTSKGIVTNTKTKFKDNGWSSQTIRRMLKNEMYVGNMVQGRSQSISYKVRKVVPIAKDNYIRKEGTHEAIIDKETFEKAQVRFRHDTWQAKGTEATSVKDEFVTGAVYVGFIKCADCQRAMQRTGIMDKQNPLYYFVCGSHQQWRQCTRHTTRVKKLNENIMMVISKFVELAVEMDVLLHEIKNKGSEDISLIRLKKEIASCEQQREQFIKLQNDLYMDLKNDILTRDQYFHFKNEYATKIAELESRQKALNEEIVKASEDITENKFVKTFKKYQNLTTLNRSAVEELIDTIYIKDDGGIQIMLAFDDEFWKAADIIESYFDSKIEIAFDKIEIIGASSLRSKKVKGESKLA